MTFRIDSPQSENPGTGDIPVVETRGLSVTFHTMHGDVQAVRGVDLTIRRGEVCGLVGESGAGKSALMRTIADVQPYGTHCTVEGEMFIDGVDFRALKPRERRRFVSDKVGLIFQDPLRSLNPSYRIGTQLTESLTNAADRLSRADRRERGLRMLKATGFNNPKDVWSRYPSQLSGGQRQRIGIGAAAIARPPLLIGDEPTTALDTTVQRQVLDVLDDIRAKSNSAFLLVTHDIDVAAERCDLIAVMRHGVIVETGPVEQIIEHPRNPYTRALLACKPKLDGPWLRRLPTVDMEMKTADGGESKSSGGENHD